MLCLAQVFLHVPPLQVRFLAWLEYIMYSYVPYIYVFTLCIKIKHRMLSYSLSFAPCFDYQKRASFYFVTVSYRYNVGILFVPRSNFIWTTVFFCVFRNKNEKSNNIICNVAAVSLLLLHTGPLHMSVDFGLFFVCSLML